MSWQSIIVVLLVVLGAFAVKSAMGSSRGPEARRLVEQGARLIDVRTPAEFSAGHIDGATNIPVDQLSGRLSALGDKSQPVVVYCRSGARSARAASMLRNAGYTNVYDLGGIGNW